MLAEPHVALDFQRYLLAKRTVDDRAMNARVWQAFVAWLAAHTGPSRAELLEIGAGVGTMLERLVERGVLPLSAYTALDADPANTLRAQERLGEWAAALGGMVREARARTSAPHRRADGPAGFVCDRRCARVRTSAGRSAYMGCRSGACVSRPGGPGDPVAGCGTSPAAGRGDLRDAQLRRRKHLPAGGRRRPGAPDPGGLSPHDG